MGREGLKGSGPVLDESLEGYRRQGSFWISCCQEAGEFSDWESNNFCLGGGSIEMG